MARSSSKVNPEMLAFLRNIKESPFEDLPRMVFADWLTDRDDLRGELIRIQCERTRLPMSDARRRKLIGRETKLLEEHQEEWTGGTHAGVEVRIQRGLLHVTIPHELLAKSSFPKALRPFLEQGWIETLKLKPGYGQGGTLAGYRPLKHVTHLDLSNYHLYDHDLQNLGESEYLQGLVSLDLGYTHFPFARLVEIAQSKCWPNLQHVSRDCDNRLGFLRRLFRKYPSITVKDLDTELPDSSLSEQWSSMVHQRIPGLINLSGNSLGDSELDDLCNHEKATELHALLLNDCDLGDLGIQVLAQYRSLKNLEVLDVGRNGIGDEGIQRLAEATWLDQVVYLQLEYNSIGDEGVTALANAPQFGQVQMLDLGPNRVGRKGLIALAESPFMKRIELMSLWNNNVGDEGIIAWANSPNAAAMRELFVGNNDISDAGAKAIINSPHLTNLRLLRLENNLGSGESNQISAAMRRKLRERFENVEV